MIPFLLLQTTSHPTVWSWVPFFLQKLAVLLESGSVLCCSPRKVEMGVSKIREHSDPPQTKRLSRPYRVHVTFHRQWDSVESALHGDGVPSLNEPWEALSSASVGQDPLIPVSTSISACHFECLFFKQLGIPSTCTGWSSLEH